MMKNLPNLKKIRQLHSLVLIFLQKEFPNVKFFDPADCTHSKKTSCSLAAQQTLRIHFLGCKNNAEKTRTVTNQAARFFFGLMLAFLYPWLNSLSYSFENSYCCGSMASPMIMIAVLVIFAFFTFDAIVCKVPKIIF